MERMTKMGLLDIYSGSSLRINSASSSVKGGGHRSHNKDDIVNLLIM